VTGVPHGHYGGVENTCVKCHLGDGADHSFEPDVDTCKECHGTATDFDYQMVQTEVDSLGTVLGDLLVTAMLIDENTEDGHPIVSSAPEDQAIALWNWLYVMHEDKSLGVHNPDYARALLEDGIARMGPTP
jgi:formate-dependent nitrite reductase cytochrome c552 subunit